MFKRSIKYLIVATVNLLALSILLVFWTDKLERMFNDSVRPSEFLKILAVTAVSLIATRALIYYFRKKNMSAPGIKLKSSILLTFLISSYLYVDYSIKFVTNVIVKRQFRQQIVEKIKPLYQLANGTKADNLTLEEYREIASINWFPKLSDKASGISYTYAYDGFLPDYEFTLTYNLPMEIKVDSINYESGDIYRFQKFVIVENVQRVHYSEGER